MTALLQSELLALPYGYRVADRGGSTWTRKHLDRWVRDRQPEAANSAELTVFYGPIYPAPTHDAATAGDPLVAQLIRELATAHGRSVNAERTAHGLPPERTP